MSLSVHKNDMERSVLNKILRMIAPILVIALSLGVVKALEATKPVAKTKEQVDYTLSLYVERAQRQDISVKVNAQGEVTARNTG